MTAKNRPCWIIVVGATPTSFRSREREVLLPTLKQLQRTQPSSRLMWFDRGRFWASEDEARLALAAQRKARETKSSDRDRDWRPGGEHKDPRARPQLSRDAKRARFKDRLVRKSRESSGTGRAGSSGGSQSPFESSARPVSDAPKRPAGGQRRTGSGSSSRPPSKWNKSGKSAGKKSGPGGPRKSGSKGPRGPRK